MFVQPRGRSLSAEPALAAGSVPGGADAAQSLGLREEGREGQVREILSLLIPSAQSQGDAGSAPEGQSGQLKKSLNEE